MVKVNWTQRALHDLEDIGDYISKDSIKYAKLTLEKLVDAALLISRNPLLGRGIIESRDKSIREIVKGNYRVIYQIHSKSSVSILTVFHTARLLSRENLE